MVYEITRIVLLYALVIDVSSDGLYEAFSNIFFLLWQVYVSFTVHILVVAVTYTAVEVQKFLGVIVSSAFAVSDVGVAELPYFPNFVSLREFEQM